MDTIYDMLIIGGGPGGYTAALYAARAGLRVLVLEKTCAGGQMALTHRIDNYPGLPEGAEGFRLGEDMRRGAERFGAETVFAEVTHLDLVTCPKAAETEERTYYGKTLVLASGADPRELGLPGEQTWKGRGISYCAQCDGMFYRDKTVAVVGGGNSAAADALLLSRVAKKVILIHRRDSLRADRISREALTDNVEFFWNTRVTGLLTGDRFRGLRLERDSGEETLLCDGVFVSIGRQPASALAAGQLELDGAGYVVAGEDTCTSIPGVYAVGDVRHKPLRQIVTAVSDGAMAVHSAEVFLSTR